jgi:hypothetical protein
MIIVIFTLNSNDKNSEINLSIENWSKFCQSLSSNLETLGIKNNIKKLTKLIFDSSFHLPNEIR